jgi:hypothetical protein
MGAEEVLRSIFEAVLQRYITIILAGQVFQTLLIIGVVLFIVGALCFRLGMLLGE